MPEVETAPQPQPHPSNHHDVNDFNIDLQSGFNSQTPIVATEFNSQTSEPTMNSYVPMNGGQSMYSHPQGVSTQDHWQLQPEQQQLQQHFQQAQQLQLQEQIQQQQQLQQQQEMLQRVKQEQLEQEIHQQHQDQHQLHLEQLQKVQIKQQHDQQQQQQHQFDQQYQSHEHQYYQLQTQQQQQQQQQQQPQQQLQTQQQPQQQQQQQQQQPNLSLGTFQNDDSVGTNNHALVQAANKLVKQENDISDISQFVNYNHVSQYVVGNPVGQNTYSAPQPSIHTNIPQAQSSVVYNVDQGLNQRQHNVPTQQVSVPQAAPPPSQLHTQPTYVNAKQYHRILKRREARHRLEEYYAKKRKQSVEEGFQAGDKRVRSDETEVFRGDGNEAGASRRPYLHESRHKHAMKRPRGPSGRFLTKDELVEYYKNHPEEDPSNFKS